MEGNPSCEMSSSSRRSSRRRMRPVMRLADVIEMLAIVIAVANEVQGLNIELCDFSLGLGDRSKVPDSAFTASSTYDAANVGPQNARLHFDSAGGAWCPSHAVSKELSGNEWLQVDLGRMSVITHTLTQGRYADGRGQEYAEAYTLQYWRPGMVDFKDYRDSLGRAVLPGNSNTYAVANNSLQPAIFASKIRFIPFSEHPRTICLRVGLIGCPFEEGVVAYSTPQGMARGALLELMDHTFDGHEDSVTGDLRGGLGQLVDGRFGRDNFKASGNKGEVKGYDWVGWKKRPSNSVNLIFAFDHVRTFSRVDIHTNNHYTKDIQVFKEAKIYFSNEEDKFGDDRFVDFKYMPDLALENARNVSVNLHGEHGQYVMIQLIFAAKWILISEVTFYSEIHTDQPFPTSPEAEVFTEAMDADDGLLGQDLVLLEEQGAHLNYEEDIDHELTAQEGDNERDLHLGPAYDDSESRNVGIVIGILLTVICILLMGILYVVWRNKRGLPSKSTPTHSLLSRKFADRFVSVSEYHHHQQQQQQNGPPHHMYTPYSNSTTTSLYGHPIPLHSQLSSSAEHSCPQTQETIYEEPHPIDTRGRGATRDLYSSGGFLSLNRKYSSDPVLSEDCTSEYAEPAEVGEHPQHMQQSAASVLASSSFNENIYGLANMSSSPPGRSKPVILQPLPIAHYARPLSPSEQQQQQQQTRPKFIASPPISARVSPPKYSAAVAMVNANANTNLLNMKSPNGSTSTNTLHSPPPLPMTQPPTASTVTPGRLQSKCQSGQTVSLLGGLGAHSRLPPIDLDSTCCTTTPTSRSSSNSTAVGLATDDAGDAPTQDDDDDDLMTSMNASFYASTDVCIPESTDLSQLCRDNNSLWNQLRQPPSRSVSIDTVTIHLKEVDRTRLHILEKLGEGQFGEIHLCRMDIDDSEDDENNTTGTRTENNRKGRLVAVKSLRRDCNQTTRADFEQDARVLTSLNDPNLIKILGVCFEEEPLCMICEYSDRGDLYQYLQDHVAETSLSKSPGVPTLSYGSLIYIASQIASGMKYLESLNFVHRDLATRNCMVGPYKSVKISDFGMSRSCYRGDYFKSQAGCLLPIRWMAWESVLLGKFTTKSDVWSFGVTLWEILTFCREQPYEHLSDDKVIANLSSMYSSSTTLPGLEKKNNNSEKRSRPMVMLPQPYLCPREVRDLMIECWQRGEKERPSFTEIHLFLQRKNLGYDPKEMPV